MKICKHYSYKDNIVIAKFLFYLMASTFLIILLIILSQSLFPWLDIVPDTFCDVNPKCLLDVPGLLIPFVILICLIPNIYPDIYIVEDGLLVEFFLWKLFVPWQDIFEIRKEKLAFVKIWEVRVRRLTFLHYLPSLFSFKFYPIIRIGNHMEDVDELLRIIKKKMRSTRFVTPVIHKEKK